MAGRDGGCTGSSRPGPPGGRVRPARPGRGAERPAFLADALEITPFRKLLYSSDAYGLCEFHRLGAPAFRRGPGDQLPDRVDATNGACRTRCGSSARAAGGNTRLRHGRPAPNPSPTHVSTATERSQFPESMIKQCLT